MNGHCGKQIDEKVRSRAMDLLKQNLSVEVISKRLCVSKTTIRKWMRTTNEKSKGDCSGR